ncbi:M48 family metalloprotease [Sphingomonas mesophila]|uniref:M48 family metalloprotease n=1 Tax=Sphingomonas mesophila TaxID=2303576 RepID=UPI000E57845D|nr:M48 family metalloprotease [Sphingomonas mesophila]
MDHGKGRGRPRPFSVAAGLAALALAGCGPPDGAVVSEADKASGAEAHSQLLAEFGGEYRGDEAAYVRALGERLAAPAGLSGQCTFTLVNSDVVNAFAVPGCYIYITRGLMGVVNSEAELGAVLGHELGHIVARHSQRQQQRSLLRSLGVFAVGLLTDSPALTQIAGAAAGLFTLRYSRTHEYEADDLGIAYLHKAGLDPYEAADMLDALGRHERHLAATRGADEAHSIPEWARTHPLSANRTRRALDTAGATGLADNGLPENRRPFLAALDGMLYGDDPEQGFVIGRAFAHPGMRIAFEAPESYSLTNSPQAILIEGPGGMRGQFAGGRARGGLEAYTGALLKTLLKGAAVEVRSSTPARVNGLDALLTEATASADGKAVAVTVMAYAAGASTYHFVMLSDPAADAARSLAALFGSFRLLGDAEVRGLRARSIDVVTPGPGDTVRSLAGRMATANPLADFLMLNGLRENARLTPGEPVKLVVAGAR